MSADNEGSSPSDEMKKKFREALAKKNAKSRGGEAHLDGDSAIQETHAAHTQRQFRRKSG
ncbi:DUF5302 domain-containing protein [Microbacterium amylolyticum]|uniref:DUF5302 domain-containing protein n=1 Tax=Microbacterium amylolyticum TaxID=936337 RepID=A0ABS4ZFV4_9MICO|nr:DUF5302 domain-containing protein [Microbacterium amylolyticum]MBP2436168.1 hypothetical protein [Microbacterium amylolyticum]